MIIPCIDLMDGKVVQLVQGREKVLERSTDEMLGLFQGFEQIQVIDLDAAMGRGSNDALVEYFARHAMVRAGGGVRTADRAMELLSQGAYRVIVGTAAFSQNGPNLAFLEELARAVGTDRITIALDSKHGHIVVNGWRQETAWTASEVIGQLEPYCGELSVHIRRQGGHDAGDRPSVVRKPEARLQITSWLRRAVLRLWTM